ncbi:hypothetical protein scyTo_0005709 [Scyliorhinus torazame]|uniref:Uncharacterized protein n=1 Tax=Scyliorhinus torazame TaxID=75743 RepID=A0A401PBR2_SCYTO|nr:hypothetical protein [Scyliorhinus torazame]
MYIPEENHQGVDYASNRAVLAHGLPNAKTDAVYIPFPEDDSNATNSNLLAVTFTYGCDQKYALYLL